MKYQEARSNQAVTRRNFLQTAGGAAMAAQLARSAAASAQPAEPLKVSIFSKHLQWLDWQGMAETAAEIGFDGVDLTVRSGGHVLPERVEQDLPKAVEIVHKAGLITPMVTAGIVDAKTPYAESILKTMSGLGIPRYRWGGFRWVDSMSIPDRLAQLKQDAARLADLNAKYKVCAMYHTHSGSEVGASIWDLWVILKDLDKEWLGVNFDIGHAVVEGGLGGWVNSLRLISPWIKGMAAKDFAWGKNAKGQWTPQWCPLGEGMVNFKRYFALLKEVKFSGPVQLHCEYPLGGADSGAKTLKMERATVIATMRKDLTTLRGWLKDAQFA